MSKELVARLAACAACMFTSALVNLVIYDWLHSIVRFKAMIAAYVSMLTFVLAFLFFLVSLSRGTVELLRLLWIGALAGWVGGAASLFLSNLTLTNGMERLIDSFRRSWLVASCVDLVLSVVLGAWLVGAVSFVVSGMVFSKLLRNYRA